MHPVKVKALRDCCQFIELLYKFEQRFSMKEQAFVRELATRIVDNELIIEDLEENEKETLIKMFFPDVAKLKLYEYKFSE